MNNLPILVSMGDACGIGPEVAVAAVARAIAASPQGRGDACLVGDVAVLRRAARIMGVALPLVVLDSVDEPAPAHALPVWQPPGLPSNLMDLPLGQVRAEAGRAAAQCIEAAVREIQGGRGRALVTAPIHKEALHAAGVAYPGHTEMLQALCVNASGTLPPVRMMLANDELRVVLVTIHVALRQAVTLIDAERVLQTLLITDEALRRFGLTRPRIAVAGLNPHAGEGGLFGDEELLHIAPAVAQAKALGLDVCGPLAPDTVFMRARHAPPHKVGEFDAVVAMTHDQGLIPVKYLGVDQGVNVTLGLPLVRTSPDHGTAFDIAGQGLADPASMCAALRMARALAASV
ncbi:4-hydroxythreonine-4-phosphate dehydrogenase PdxA [Roseateles sp. BYS180W]|uniref:4-hydroxythreonine-4-phosphate dehydrogenase PdxA n=1 Tax=Roseateles rivi TaxID=3299028 RepID=A0ABW7FW32_9BURK